MGPVATVWDGEIAGLERGIKAAGNRDWDILLLTDSKAAIEATKNAGIRGKARTRALAALGNEINKRQACFFFFFFKSNYPACGLDHGRDSGAP